MPFAFAHYSLLSVATVSVATCLGLYSPSALLFGVFAATIFLLAQFALANDFSTPALLKLAKQLCEVPFGLGLLCVCALWQAPWTETAIVVGVLVNVAMMALTPAGGAVRGVTSKVVCLLLTAWLVQLLRANNGRVVFFDRHLFVYTALSTHWIACHTVYRLLLVTLPVFATRRYLTLELCTIASMAALHALHGAYPLAHYFGYADSLSVCGIMLLGAFTDKPTLSPRALRWTISEKTLDCVAVPCHLIIAVVALMSIVDL